LALWAITPYGHSDASVPPVTISRVPSRTSWRACPMASSAPACSAQMTPQAPRMPYLIEIWPVVAA
jgi:hypothetical protein